MNRDFFARVFTVGLTIFAMLFGSGNLMFPPKLGIEIGQHFWAGFLGFFLSGVVLPMIGLLAIVAFDGDYQKFFGRLRAPLGDIVTFICMFTIGPVVIMPRIVMFSYEMLRPFLPLFVSPLLFSLFFVALVFVATYRPGRLLDIVGKFLSPLKVLTLIIIVIAGLFNRTQPLAVSETPWELFSKAFNYGYLTLDLLGSIFFGAIIVNLLTRYASAQERLTTSQAVKVTAAASIFAGLLLGGVYLGMTMLGTYHGQGLEHLNEGEIFSAVAFRVLGNLGAAFIAASVFLACFTTCVSLTAVIAEYVQIKSGQRLSYGQSVLGVLALCAFIAQFGLGYILGFSIPFIIAFYPIIVVITLCNVAYKVFGFEPITVPVLITAAAIVVYNYKLILVPACFLWQCVA